MSRFAPLLLLGSTACVFQPPAADPPFLGGKDAELPDRSIDPNDAGDDADAGEDAGTIDAEEENRAPIAVPDRATTAPATAIDIAVLANDSDPDGDPVALVWVSAPQNGTATITASRIRYAPAPAFVGTDRFDYRIEDGNGGEATASVEIFVVADPLVLSPSNADINLNSRGSFTASGGVAPRTFRIAAGTGEIDPVTGAFFSPGDPGKAVVVVEDAIGQTASATVTFGTGDLYYIGGFGTGDEEDVFRSEDGVRWTRVGGLPTPLYLHGATVYDDQIWVAGGRNQSFDASQLVSVSRDGANWATANMLPTSLRGGKLIVFQQQLLFIGGRDGSNTERDEIWSLNAQNNWIVAGHLPSPRSYGTAFVYDRELWYVGGWDAGARTEVYSTSDLNNWTERGSLPGARYFMASAHHREQMWLIGGTTDGDEGEFNVWRTSDGLMFTLEAGLPMRNASPCAIAWKDDLWVIGGGTNFSFGSQSYDSALTRTQSGEWVERGRLPSGRFHGAVVIYKR